MFNKGAPHRPKGRKPKAGNEKNKDMRKEVKKTDGSAKQTKTEPGWAPMQSAYFTFNGSNEYLEFPSCALLNNLEELTLMAWVFPQRQGDQRIFSKSVAGNDQDGYGLDMHDNHLRFLGSSGNMNCRSTRGTLRLQEWVHVACTFKREADGFKLFLNGEVDSSVTPNSSLVSNNFGLRIGLPPFGMPYSGHLFGGIAHASVWNKALSPSQVAEYARTNLSSLPAEELAEMGLVAALTFNDVFKDGKTLYIQDLSSNVLHARYFGRVHGEAKHLQQSNIRHVALPGMKPIPWTIHTHHCFSLGFKEAVRTILLLVVRGRNQDLGGEPYFHLLPMELLFCIFSSLAE